MAINGLNLDQLKAAPTQLDSPSVYSLCAESPKLTKINEKIVKDWHQVNKDAVGSDDYKNYGYKNSLPAYKKIERAPNKKDYNDRVILTELFDNESGKVTFKNIFGNSIKDVNSVYTRFNRARSFVFQALAHFPETLIHKSFPATYFHKDIAMMFDKKAKPRANKLGMFDPRFVKKRVSGTADIMLRITYGAKRHGWSDKIWPPHTLADCLMLAAMHNHETISNHRDDEHEGPLYNQSSIAFTLLTFSYLLAVPIKQWVAENTRPIVSWEGSTSEKDWYFFWQTLGSTMGVRSELLPNTHQGAEKLWKEYLASDEIRGKKHLENLIGHGVNSINLGYFAIGTDTDDDVFFGSTFRQVRTALTELKNHQQLPDGFIEDLDIMNSRHGLRVRQNASLALLDSLRYEMKNRETLVLTLQMLPELRALVNIRNLLEVYKKIDPASVVNVKWLDSESWRRALLWQQWPLTIRA